MTRARAPQHARVTCLAAAHLLGPDIRAAYNRCPDPAASTAGPAAHDRCPRDRSRQPRPAGIDEATTRHRLNVRRCAKASPYHGRSARPALGTASVTEPLVIGREDVDRASALLPWFWVATGVGSAPGPGLICYPACRLVVLIPARRLGPGRFRHPPALPVRSAWPVPEAGVSQVGGQRVRCHPSTTEKGRQ